MSNIKALLSLPHQAELFAHIEANAERATQMVGPGTHVGKSVAICGAGPTLAHEDVGDVDDVWACNSALPYLLTEGRRVTHGFAIDQGLGMLAAHEWGTAPDVRYLLGTCVHPGLTDHLLAHGREVSFFHSYLGIPDPDGWAGDVPYEMHLYTTRFPLSIRVGFGLNAVPRAMCLAAAMGFERIRVVGADCGTSLGERMPEYGTPEYRKWVMALTLYADGRTAGGAFGAEESIAEGFVGGKLWHSRPDMLVSATAIAELAQALGERVEIVGDTLPAALLADEKLLAGMPQLSGFGEITNMKRAVA